MGGKSGGTIGYWYILTMLNGLWRGPINALLAIEADKKFAWVGETSDSSIVKIDKPDLFGGKEKEGGIQGAFRLQQGARTQVLGGATSSGLINTTTHGPVSKGVTLPDIKAAIGGRVSEMRGFASVLWRGAVTAMSPYAKEWHYCGYRTTAGWFGGTAWYPAKATICMAGDGIPVVEDEGTILTGFGAIIQEWIEGATPDEPITNLIRAMNPAHIIYQVLTDPEWGASRAADELDENSFILAANTLCDEGFGLCINWARQEDVDTFIQSVLDHIAGALYTDRTTGKIVLKLIRDDYDPEDLPLYDYNSGLLEIEEDDSASSDEMINEIIVKGKDQSIGGMGDSFEVRVHNNSARQAQGAISDTLDLPGIPTRAMALRRGQMELRTHAPGLKRFKLKLDRRAWGITPAAVIRISAGDSHSINNMIVRLGNDVEYGDTTDGAITVSAIEDVFGLPDASFQSVGGGSTWVPPSRNPEPAAATKLIEAGYRDLVLNLSASDLATVADTAAFIGQLAKSPGFAFDYDLLSRVSGEPSFVDRGTGSFTEAATLNGAITALATSIVVDDLAGISDDFLGQALIIGNEIVRLDAVDTGTNTLTVARGCADTIPAAHADADIIWVLDDDLTPDGREYAATEIVETKVLTKTSNGRLAEADAPTDTVTVVARHYKPYPPGDVQVDATSVFSLSGYYAEPVLTWTHRDRLSEDDQLIEHGATSVGPEAGTTYTIRVKPAGGGTPLRTVPGISGTTWTYDATMQAADGSPDTVLIELESVRSGQASWQMYSITVPLLPPAASLVTLDFKNGAYSIGGVSKTLAEVVEENTGYGTFTSSDVVAGVGLKVASTSSSVSSSPILTSDAFDAVTAAGVADGFTAVMTYSLTSVGSTTQAGLLVEMLDALPTTAGWGFEASWDTPTGAELSCLYDYDTVFEPALMGSSGAHKAALTLSSTRLAVSYDGNTEVVSSAPQVNAATIIALSAFVNPNGSGTCEAILERIDFIATAADVDLPTLSTP